MQQDATFSSQFKIFFGLAIVVKFILLITFSSGYQESLFIPFVFEFLERGDNPWEYSSASIDAFPYPPLMLYILSIVLAPLQYIDPDSTFYLISKGILYGLPLILSDLVITAILIRMFIWHKTEIFVFYFFSPIIIFSTYMHGQLDIIPTAILFVSIFLLSKHFYFISALCLGLAISTKFHTVAALPIMVIFLMNQGKFKPAALMLALPFLIYYGFSIPYLGTGESYGQQVLQNQKQSLIFGSYFSIGSVQVYLPLLAAAVIYIRFSAYKKVNSDLLYAVTGALFSIFLLLIEPSPAWYVWLTPFFTIFYIRYFDGYQHYLLFSSLMIFYLTYYLFFHHYDHSKLLFLGEEVIFNTPNTSLPLANIIFTGLQAILLASIYQFYKNGIQSNNTYAMQQSFVIGIGGDSGAGKTTLIHYLKAMFDDQLLELEGDSDHKWERGDQNWQEFTHLDPKANALHKQAEQVRELKYRRSIRRSDYDHNTGKFTELDTIKPKDFIVLAGLHPFYLPKMRKIMDLKIFLNLDERLRTSWKITRDCEHRGYSEQQVLDSLAKRESDSNRYIRPQKQFSDLVISLHPAEEDKFEGHVYKGKLSLTIEMNASIPLDRVIPAFQQAKCDLHWDYSEDLSNQLVSFNLEPSGLDINWFVNNYITNSSELIHQPNWLPGYAGVTQFLIIFAISEIMKDRNIHNV